MAKKGSVSDLTSMVIALVRFPLPMAVMAEHVFRTEPFVVKGHVYAPDDFALPSLLIRFVDSFVDDFSVPIFFFISGFLFFAGGFGREAYLRKLRSRGRSLLLPYIVWNIAAVAFAAMLYLPLFARILPSLAGESFQMTASEFVLGFAGCTNELSLPHAGNLWYVRELMTVVLLAPFIYLGIKKLRWWFMGALAVFWACFFVTAGTMYFQFVSTALLFFSCGAWFSIYNIDPAPLFRRVWKPALALFLLVGSLSMWLGPSTSLPVRTLKLAGIPSVLCLVFSAAALWGNSSLRRKIFGPVSLADAIPGVAFFVFVSHGVVLWHFKIAVFGLFRPRGDVSFFFTFLALYAILLGALIVFYWLLGLAWPWLQRVLSGRA